MGNAGAGYSDRGLVDDLRTWWHDQVEADPFADPTPSRAGTIFEVMPVIDSLGVVSALITIEKHVGFTVSPRLIKPGGYRGFDEMASDLLPKIRALAAKRREKEIA
jgi:hypothetical protein